MDDCCEWLFNLADELEAKGENDKASLIAALFETFADYDEERRKVWVRCYTTFLGSEALASECLQQDRKLIDVAAAEADEALEAFDRRWPKIGSGE